MQASGALRTSSPPPSKLNVNSTASEQILGPTSSLARHLSLPSLAKLTFHDFIHLGMLFYVQLCMCKLGVYLLRTRNLVQVIDKSAFMARTSSAGIATVLSFPMTASRMVCRSVFPRTVNSLCNCSIEDPLLTISLTCSISELLLVRVLLEAALDSTLGVVTLTTDRG